MTGCLSRPRGVHRRAVHPATDSSDSGDSAAESASAALPGARLGSSAFIVTERNGILAVRSRQPSRQSDYRQYLAAFAKSGQKPDFHDLEASYDHAPVPGN
jgi:hypothetical protein